MNGGKDQTQCGVWGGGGGSGANDGDAGVVCICVLQGGRLRVSQHKIIANGEVRSTHRIKDLPVGAQVAAVLATEPLIAAPRRCLHTTSKRL
jgi:hypothetical protein